MAETLYRKYRPQTFADVAEQRHVTRTVMNQLASGTVAHAYLFAGPRGVGKTTVARLLAKALNCEGRKAGEAEPCNACSACQDMSAGRFLSCVEIDAASQTGVDNVRENIIENARFAPARGKFKVFILDEVHMLSSASFNALLKTLEEPPAHAVFILATTETHKIPATIVSRCQRFDFHRVPAGEMVERLKKISAAEGISVDEDVLVSIARLSEGCLRDAESLLGQLFALGETTITQQEASLVLPATNLTVVADIAAAAAAKDLPKALTVVNDFVRDGGSMKHLVDELLEYARTLMFAAIGFTDSAAYDPKTMEGLVASAQVMGSLQTRRFVDLLLSARTRQSLNAFPQIPLEIALAELCQASDSSNPLTSQPLNPAPKTPPTPQPLNPSKQPSTSPNLPRPSVETPALVQPPSTKYDFTEPPADDSPKAQVEGDALTFSIKELQDKWERCCAHVSERNIALPLILKDVKPTAIEGSIVVITCPYAFHADALGEGKNRRLIEDAIESVMMTKVAIRTECGQQKEQKDAVEDFVTALGGSMA